MDPGGNLGALSMPCFGRPRRKCGREQTTFSRTKNTQIFIVVLMGADILSRENTYHMMSI